MQRRVIAVAVTALMLWLTVPGRLTFYNLFVSGKQFVTNPEVSDDEGKVFQQ